MTHEPEFILHGGFHKTATSHIQSTLGRNVAKLKRAGIHYVHHRDTRKRLTVPVSCNVYNKIGLDWDPNISDEDLKRMTAAFFEEVMASGAQRIILSDENMAGHCGHCVKRGLLYRWRGKLVETFAAQFIGPVSEVHLGIRNYADFFASAYIEYLRSYVGSRFVGEASMRRQVLANMPNWHKVLKTVKAAFPDARLIVWPFENFRKIDATVLQNLCGEGVDIADLKAPNDKNKRPSASGRAVRELLQAIYREGSAAALERRVEIQERFPRGQGYGSYDPWTAQERAHLTRIYHSDLAAIRHDPAIELLGMAEAV